MGNNYVNYFKFGPVIQEEMSFKEKVYGQRMKTDCIIDFNQHLFMLLQKSRLIRQLL